MYGCCFTGTFLFIDSLLIRVSAHVDIIRCIFVNFDAVDSVLGKHGRQEPWTAHWQQLYKYIQTVR
jgi:hypothetical protein